MTDYAPRSDTSFSVGPEATGPRDALTTTYTVRWSAITVGVVVALVAQIIFSFVGAAFGFSTVMFDPGAPGTPSADTAARAAFTWWAVSGIIAGGLGGFATGFATPDRVSARVNAFVAWCTTIVLITAVLAGIGGGTVASFGGPIPLLNNHIAAAPGDAEVYRDLIAALSLWSVIALLIGVLVQITMGRIGFDAKLHSGPRNVSRARL